MARKPKITNNPNENWANDCIQFPRLIAELEGAGAFTPEVLAQLSEEMGLSLDRLDELVERAQKTWDDIKARTA